VGEGVRTILTGSLGRFHADLSQAKPGAEISLSASESHHLLRVLRARPGAALRVFGGGVDFMARLVRCGEGTAVVILEHPIEPPPPPRVDIWATVPFLKGGRTEFLAEKLTEMGIAGFIAYSAARDVARPGPEKAERLGRVVLAACKQCERADIPPVVTASNLANALKAGPANAHRIILLERSGASRLGEVAASIKAESAGRPAVMVATGPEGGFDPAEIDACDHFRPASLGPRILRADTAPLVAAAVILREYGEW
jgi:16S rRNA (uracil1498-N3)-methyltransferase